MTGIQIERMMTMIDVSLELTRDEVLRYVTENQDQIVDELVTARRGSRLRLERSASRCLPWQTPEFRRRGCVISRRDVSDFVGESRSTGIPEAGRG